MRNALKSALLLLFLSVVSANAQSIIGVVCAVQTAASPWTPVSALYQCNATDGPSYLVSSGVDVLGACNNGLYPEAGTVMTGTCGTYKVISASVGGADNNWRWFGMVAIGEVWGNSVLLNLPGSNPTVTEKTNCYYQTLNSADVVGPC